MCGKGKLGDKMTTEHRQRDHTQVKSKQRLRQNGVVIGAVSKRRHDAHTSGIVNQCMIHFAQKYIEEENEQIRYSIHRERIASRGWDLFYDNLTDRAFLELFRFRRKEFERLSEVVGFQDGTHTKKNRYAVDPIFSTAIVLRRLASPARWCDLNNLFFRHSSHLSEIFWETIEHFMEKYYPLLLNIPTQFIRQHAEQFSNCIQNCSNALSNCIGFIDGTVIAIARPGTDAMQRDCYNGHKRKHALKYQAITTPDGMVLNLCRPVVGRRHDWYMYIMSGLDEVLPEVLLIDGIRYCIWGDPGYNNRWYLETPFQGANLTPAQQALNTAMSSVRITVEWAFKEVKLYWASVDYKRKLRLFESPIAMIYQAAVLLTNLRNCFYPNQLSRYFNCAPPTFEEYISLLE